MSQAVRLGTILVIGLTVFVSTLRPLTQASGHFFRPLGLTRLSLVSEPASDHGTLLVSPAMVNAPVLALLPVGVVLMVLKTRRASRRVVPLRRLKLPPRGVTSSLSSD
jgi:hypothetical protein